jgi:SAM-dependent methyltransferase
LFVTWPEFTLEILKMTYLERTLCSPRWQWLNQILGPFVWSGNPDNQWLRTVMNQELDALVQSIQPSRLSALEISGTNWERPGLFREYLSLDYPEFDICAGPTQERYDFVVAEQVFEHLLWPYRAARNVVQMLNPGGYFLISTPFLVKIHNFPVDCSRWTELGLKHFLAECGFPLEKIVTGSWGNRACVDANLGSRWVIYQKWRHSLKNDPEFPVSVWALAQVGGKG